MCIRDRNNILAKNRDFEDKIGPFFRGPPNKRIKVLPNEGPTQFWPERWYYSRMMKKIFRMMESFSYTMKKLTLYAHQIWRFFPTTPHFLQNVKNRRIYWRYGKMSKMKVVRKKISFLVKKKIGKFCKKRNKNNIPLFWTLKKKSKLYFSKVEGLLKTPGSGDV